MNFWEVLLAPEICIMYKYSIRGHSTTTWTNSDSILTPSPPRVDKRGHFTNSPMSTWTKIDPSPHKKNLYVQSAEYVGKFGYT